MRDNPIIQVVQLSIQRCCKSNLCIFKVHTNIDRSPGLSVQWGGIGVTAKPLATWAEGIWTYEAIGFTASSNVDRLDNVTIFKDCMSIVSLSIRKKSSIISLVEVGK